MNAYTPTCVTEKQFPRPPGGLIQKENGRIFDYGPCDGNTLLLTAGKRSALFTNLVVHGLGIAETGAKCQTCMQVNLPAY